MALSKVNGLAIPEIEEYRPGVLAISSLKRVTSELVLRPDRAAAFPKFTLRLVLVRPVRLREPDALTSVRVGETSIRSINRVARLAPALMMSGAVATANSEAIPLILSRCTVALILNCYRNFGSAALTHPKELDACATGTLTGRLGSGPCYWVIAGFSGPAWCSAAAIKKAPRRGACGWGWPVNLAMAGFSARREAACSMPWILSRGLPFRGPGRSRCGPRPAGGDRRSHRPAA